MPELNPMFVVLVAAAVGVQATFWLRYGSKLMWLSEELRNSERITESAAIGNKGSKLQLVSILALLAGFVACLLLKSWLGAVVLAMCAILGWILGGRYAATRRFSETALLLSTEQLIQRDVLKALRYMAYGRTDQSPHYFSDAVKWFERLAPDSSMRGEMLAALGAEVREQSNLYASAEWGEEDLAAVPHQLEALQGRVEASSSDTMTNISAGGQTWYVPVPQFGERGVKSGDDVVVICGRKSRRPTFVAVFHGKLPF